MVLNWMLLRPGTNGNEVSNGKPTTRTSTRLIRPRPVVTAFTLGLGSHEEVRRRARAARGLPLIKLKVDAQRHLDLLNIVRDELPHWRDVLRPDLALLATAQAIDAKRLRTALAAIALTVEIRFG